MKKLRLILPKAVLVGRLYEPIDLDKVNRIR